MLMSTKELSTIYEKNTIHFTTTSGIYASLLTQEPMFQVESMAVVQRPRYEMSSSLPRPVSRLSELKVGNTITNVKLYSEPQ